MISQYNQLLWIFTQLPNNYLVLDTETTGLVDKNGLPDIVTLGITVVSNREIAESIEFQSQWSQIADYLKDQLIVIHNASFDWPILLDHVARYRLEMPEIQGVFCSQRGRR